MKLLEGDQYVEVGMFRKNDGIQYQTFLGFNLTPTHIFQAV
jgi:Uma2 family endonuclease